MLELFVIFIYQPFLNLLVGIYWVLTKIPTVRYADMGIAVIIFTIALRFLMLPLTISASRSLTERRDIEDKLKEIKDKHKNDPVALRRETRSIFKTNRRVVLAETVNLVIQVMIAFMLWRIFAKGLLGEDLHLLYGFMPDIPQPYHLSFLNAYDLTHPNLTLNLIQSLMIFLAEMISLITSPFPVNRKDVIRLQIVLPVVSFLIFSQLPAGKKLFIITSLSFSLVFMLIRQVRYLIYKYFSPKEPAPSSVPSPIQPGEGTLPPSQ